MNDLKETCSQDLLTFAKAWASLGENVCEQVERVLDEHELADVNGDAVLLAWERLGGMNEDVDMALKSWLDLDDSERVGGDDLCPGSLRCMTS